MSWKPDFGNLTIEKVTRDGNGHQKPGSLVFRIRRITCKRNDDSGIKCSSPSTDDASDDEQQENSTSPQKINTPRTLLASDDEETESGLSECNSPEDNTAPDKAEDQNDLNDGTGIKGEDTAAMDTDSVSTVSETEVPKSYELRRSSQRILLRLQKECQQDLPVTKATRTDHKIPAALNCNDRQVDLPVTKASRAVHKAAAISILKKRQLVPTANVRRKRGKKPGRPGSSVNRAPRIVHGTHVIPIHNYRRQLPPVNIVKRKRGRKPGRPEIKKRKYVRRKPIKSMLQSDLSIANSVITGSDQKENERIFPQPSKNTVWTLVPKELFESEFFKSQVLKVRYTNPIKEQSLATSSRFPPATTTRRVPYHPNTRIRLKFPRIIVNSVPVVQQNFPVDKANKRPTVIYFKKSCDENPPNQQPEPNRQPHLNITNELALKMMKSQDDLLYLCNKYRILDATVVKNYYEFTRCDVNETDSLLMDLLSKNLVASPEPRTSDSQSNINNCSINVNNPVSCDNNILHRSETPVLSSSMDVNDTLCRIIIVESMKILFSEEAVLQ